MKIAAVIAEYNPFHNGHLYQIEEIRRQTGCTYVLAVMSGNFVQRGAPALIDKITRTKMALYGGADAVLELPAYWSTSSAEGFARGAVGLLCQLGCVDYLCFGCETPELFTATKIPAILNEEPDEYKTTLKAALKSGSHYAAARSKALLSYIQNHTAHSGTEPDLPFSMETLEAALQEPNNILGLEYCRALAYFSTDICPVPILRKGSSYHDMGLQDTQYPSAAAIRSLLSQPPVTENIQKPVPDGDTAFLLRDQIPAAVLPHLLQYEQEAVFLSEQHFSASLHVLLIHKGLPGLLDCYGCSESLAHRITNCLPDYTDWADFCKILKTKNTAYTQISRILTHMLLDITNEEVLQAAQGYYTPYARLLGFCTSAAGLLKTISRHTSIPLITKAGHIKQLDETARQIIECDLRATKIYNSALTAFTGRYFSPDYKNFSLKIT